MCLRLKLDNTLYGAGMIQASAYLCRSWMYAPAAWIIFCHESSLKWLQSEQSSSCLGLIDIQEIKKQTELFDECRLYNLGEMRDLHYLIVFFNSYFLYMYCEVNFKLGKFWLSFKRRHDRKLYIIISFICNCNYVQWIIYLDTICTCWQTYENY